MLRLLLDGPACWEEVWAAAPMGSKRKGAKARRVWADLLQWWGECPASSLQFPELGQVQVLRELKLLLYYFLLPVRNHWY